jgi:hypothetical protein
MIETDKPDADEGEDLRQAMVMAEVFRQAMIIAEDRAAMEGKLNPYHWASRHCSEARFLRPAMDAVVAASARRRVWSPHAVRHRQPAPETSA